MLPRASPDLPRLKRMEIQTGAPVPKGTCLELVIPAKAGIQ